MVQPKSISRAGIPKALEKATRYRLLNEPLQAESICRDILVVDQDNPEAIEVLLLAITDQFETGHATTLNHARSLLSALQGEYERAYYEGIINERWGNAQLNREGPTSIEWYRSAMRCYAKAEELSEPDNDDAILRWNTCVRIMERYNFAPEGMTHDIHAQYGDHVPPQSD